MANTVISLNQNYLGSLVIAAEKIEDRIERIHRVAEMSYSEILEEAKNQIDAPSKENMTLEEYKNFVIEELQKITRHPSLFKDDETVIISDAGFAAMKNNPEYEAWVFDYVREALSHPDYLCFYPGNYGRSSVFQFGESQEDYHGTMCGKHSRTPVNTEKSYWELRLEKLKKRLEAEQEWFEKRSQLEDSGQRLAERRALQAAALGLDDAIKPALPITGIPAELLLQLL